MDDLDTRRPSRPEILKEHRRETFRQIIIPLAVAASLLVAAALIAAFGAGPGGRSAAASWLAVLCMVPVTLVAMVVAILLSGLAWIVGQAKSISDLMAGLRDVLYEIDSTISIIAEKSVGGAIAWEGKFAYLERIISRMIGGRDIPDE